MLIELFGRPQAHWEHLFTGIVHLRIPGSRESRPHLIEIKYDMNIHNLIIFKNIDKIGS